MTSLADRAISALRANHDELAALVPSLTDDQLTGRSGAAEWSVAQVLSHLGSGAEIGLAGFTAAVTGGPVPAGDFNQSVWDRWNAMDPQGQAAGFLEHDARLVGAFEALTDDQRGSVQVQLGFVPMPLSIASFAGMRLNEVAQHSWDVRVATDPGATIDSDTAQVLAEQFSGGIGFLLGFIGKADALAEPAVVDIGDSGFAFVIADGASLSASAPGATASFAGPLEAAIRLIGGRLTSSHTPDGIAVTGNVTLDDLRRVFPGY